MISKEDFFRKYNKTEKDLISANISWKELTNIIDDYEKIIKNFATDIESFVIKLYKIPNIHSIKYRMKDPEHLIEKIIRKNIKRFVEGKKLITSENYINEITDLIGMRIFHLYKDDGIDIAKYILSEYKSSLFEGENGPYNIYYYAKGDNLDEEKLNKIFAPHKISFKKHNNNYRSIHITVKISEVGKSESCLPVEIQIRTLAQEIWAETDHKFRYPNNTEDESIEIFSKNLNITANMLDEMVSNSIKLIEDHNEKEELLKENDKNKIKLLDLLMEKIKGIEYTKESEKIIHEYFSFFGNNLNVYYDYNKISDFFNNDNEKIVDYLNIALKINSESYYIYNNFGYLHYNQRNYEKAEENYLKAIKLGPNYSKAYNNLGILYKNQNKYNEAEKMYLKAIELEPNYTNAYNNLGILYKSRNKYAEAEKMYKKVIDLDPNFSDIYYNLGNLYSCQEKYYDEAEKMYLKSIELDHNYISAYNNLGVLYKNQNKYAEAEKMYKKVIDLDPNFSDTYNNLGNLYKNQNKYDEAEKMLLKGIDLDHDDSDAYNNLGILYKNQNNYDKAKENYLKAIDLDHDYSDAYNNFGNLYKNQNKYDEAEKMLLKGIDLDHDDSDIYYNLYNLYKAQNKTELAEEMYKKYEELKKKKRK